MLAAVAGATYYFGTPALQPSARPSTTSCAGAVTILVDNSTPNSTISNYQPPKLNLVLGVNSTVAWTDEDTGFEVHVISVAVPAGAQDWDLNMTNTPGENTQCLALPAAGTYTYEMFIPYVVAGTIVVKSPTSTS